MVRYSGQANLRRWGPQGIHEGIHLEEAIGTTQDCEIGAPEGTLRDQKKGDHGSAHAMRSIRIYLGTSQGANSETRSERRKSLGDALLDGIDGTNDEILRSERRIT